jgi:signal-transduction protein with cAMP-binding, CBS, and nucleotidyltransferase domain
MAGLRTNIGHLTDKGIGQVADACCPAGTQTNGGCGKDVAVTSGDRKYATRVQCRRGSNPMAGHHELLAAVPLFAHLPDKAIEDLDKTAVERRYDSGAEIVSEGEAGVAFFVINGGTAEVTHGCTNAAPVTLRPGDYFGEMALIDGQRRSATVRALTPVTCLALTRWDFRALVHADAGLAVSLLGAMSRRVRALEDQLAEAKVQSRA